MSISWDDPEYKELQEQLERAIFLRDSARQMSDERARQVTILKDEIAKILDECRNSGVAYTPAYEPHEVVRKVVSLLKVLDAQIQGARVENTNLTNTQALYQRRISELREELEFVQHALDEANAQIIRFESHGLGDRLIAAFKGRL